MFFNEQNTHRSYQLLISFSLKNVTLDFLSIVSSVKIDGLYLSFNGLLLIEDRLVLSSSRSLLRFDSILNHMLITTFCRILSSIVLDDMGPFRYDNKSQRLSA